MRSKLEEEAGISSQLDPDVLAATLRAVEHGMSPTMDLCNVVAERYGTPVPQGAGQGLPQGQNCASWPPGGARFSTGRQMSLGRVSGSLELTRSAGLSRLGSSDDAVKPNQRPEVDASSSDEGSEVGPV